MNVHDFLEKPKNRALLLATPLIVIISTITLISLYSFGFELWCYLFLAYILAAIWLLVVVSILYWSDMKTFDLNKKYGRE